MMIALNSVHRICKLWLLVLVGGVEDRHDDKHLSI